MITDTRLAALVHYTNLERFIRITSAPALWRCPYCQRSLPDENALCCGEAQAVRVGSQP